MPSPPRTEPPRTDAKALPAKNTPGRDCPRCPRLVAFRKTWREQEPQWFNAPVESFGPRDARLLIVGLAPGLRCVPPKNKPTPQEIATCRPFLTATIVQMPRLRAVIALGRIAHETLIVARVFRRSLYPFTHGRAHAIGEIKLFDSYHCSRYNTNTGVLTPQMFREVFTLVREHLDDDA